MGFAISLYRYHLFQKIGVEEYCRKPDYVWMGSKAFPEDWSSQSMFEDAVLNYAKENIAMVTIYIREPFTEEILISERISPLAFISDIGGLMGLFMGCSFVSAVEVIYHITKVFSTLTMYTASQKHESTLLHTYVLNRPFMHNKMFLKKLL